MNVPFFVVVSIRPIEPTSFLGTNSNQGSEGSGALLVMMILIKHDKSIMHFNLVSHALYGFLLEVANSCVPSILQKFYQFLGIFLVVISSFALLNPTLAFSGAYILPIQLK